ncbi:hypothetical protein Tco_0766977 [Tanacetum coccineum]
MLVWGEAEFRNFAKGFFERKLFKDMLHGFGGRLIKFMHLLQWSCTCKDMKIQAGVQVQDKENSEDISFKLWKVLWEDFISVGICYIDRNICDI